jgi:predicted transcriptional regulator
MVRVQKPDSVRPFLATLARTAKRNAASELDPGLLTAQFHRVDSLIPDGQEVFWVPPDMPALEALQAMRERGFSQVPIKTGNEVLGVFSYRSFAAGVVRHRDIRGRFEALPVDEFREDLQYARPTDDIEPLLDVLLADGAVLVGERDNLLAILTATDVLQALYELTSTYLLLQEIELALRKVIHLSLAMDEFLKCVERSLSSLYEGRKDQLPKTVEDLAFGEYVSLFGHGENWAQFQPLLGSTRDVVCSRLRPINQLRNDVLHFKRTLAPDERDELVELRDWLFMKLRAIQSGHRRRTQ